MVRRACGLGNFGNIVCACFELVVILDSSLLVLGLVFWVWVMLLCGFVDLTSFAFALRCCFCIRWFDVLIIWVYCFCLVGFPWGLK